MVAANLTSLFNTLITGLHILHYNGVLDAYGHMSVRNPNNVTNFFMSRDVAPANVANSTDIVEYLVSDASPLDPNAPKGFIERYIHSELYKRFPGINSVVHSHSSAVIPYSFSGVPMRSSIHMAGFLGDTIPVYNILDYYNSSDTYDLLVSSIPLGAALANLFTSTNATSLANATQTQAAHAVVLMQNHGFTTVADSIELAVMQAVYTQINAGVQTTAVMLRGAYAPGARFGCMGAQGGIGGGGGGGGVEAVQYLTTRETVDSWSVISGTSDRPWGLWQHEVQSSNLYQNLLDPNQTKAASPLL